MDDLEVNKMVFLWYFSALTPFLQGSTLYHTSSSINFPVRRVFFTYLQVLSSLLKIVTLIVTLKPCIIYYFPVSHSFYYIVNIHIVNTIYKHTYFSPL